MKTLFASVILLISISMYAQMGPPPGGGRPDGPPNSKKEKPKMLTPTEKAENLSKDLSLTDEQRTRVEAVYELQEAEMKQKFQSGQKPDFSQDPDQSIQADLQEILSEEQFKKYQEIQDQRKSQKPNQEGISIE